MKERIIKDVPASIRQRLLNIARETGRPFGELLQYYTMERFLYRLSISPVGRKFVLKGALMLVAWKAPVSVEYPTILDMPRPRLLGYTRESTIAEKYHVMVKLGILNSRMRDFFDIWLLSKQFEYDGENLSIAIRKTFAKRGTEVPSIPTAFGDSFSRDKAKVSQWKSFLMKNRLPTASEDMGDVIRDLSAFLGPVSKAIAAREMFQGTWHPPGPWIGKRLG